MGEFAARKKKVNRACKNPDLNDGLLIEGVRYAIKWNSGDQATKAVRLHVFLGVWMKPGNLEQQLTRSLQPRSHSFISLYTMYIESGSHKKGAREKERKKNRIVKWRNLTLICTLKGFARRRTGPTEGGWCYIQSQFKWLLFFLFKDDLVGCDR